MKTKIIRFKGGNIAIIKGIGVRVNGKSHIIEQAVGNMTEKEINSIMKNPKKFRFSKKAKKLKT